MNDTSECCCTAYQEERMSPFEIVIIVIGIICIIVSCFLVDHKKEDTVETELGTVTEQILYSQLSTANEKISEHVNQLKEDVFETTRDEMNRISNEKIMSVHEYSDQAINDIKKNHEEVLFLYQMLTDKEDELKKSLTEMQQTKSEIEKYCNAARETMTDSDAEMEVLKVISSKSGGEETSTNQGHSKSYQKAQNPKSKNRFEATEIDQDNHYMKALQDIEDNEFSSHIDDILELSSQGCSVIEISKRLGLGQGEVKLVLDYNKK